MKKQIRITKERSLYSGEDVYIGYRVFLSVFVYELDRAFNVQDLKDRILAHYTDGDIVEEYEI